MFSPLYSVEYIFSDGRRSDGPVIDLHDVSIIMPIAPVSSILGPMHPDENYGFQIHADSLTEPLLVVRPSADEAWAERDKVIAQWHAVVDTEESDEEDEDDG